MTLNIYRVPKTRDYTAVNVVATTAYNIFLSIITCRS